MTSIRVGIVPTLHEYPSVRPLDAPADTMIVDNHGLVLTNVNVYTIFWGVEWQGVEGEDAPFTPFFDSIRSILTGPYMSALSQYRNVGSGTLKELLVEAIGAPSLDFPSGFSEQDIRNRLTLMIQSNSLNPSEDSQHLYCVMMPQGARFTNPNVVGSHSFYTPAGLSTKVHYAWCTNDGTVDGFNSIPRIFSHELVEACTDPEGDAFQIVPSNPINWNEIGDVCNSSEVRNGVRVQSYWSQRDKACIIPR